MITAETDTTYNGCANYETWNVSLWLQNDEGLYNLSQEFTSYQDLAECLKEGGSFETPDGVAWTDSALDYDELNEMVKDL